MKANVIKITPKKAKELLEKNTGNRIVSPKRVAQYAQNMVDGDWEENGESIIFDKKGVLKNGQHRLKATIKADHTWNAVVVTEVEPKVMHTLDTGKFRSLKDFLDIEGYKNTAAKAAILKAIIACNKGYVYHSNKLVGLQYITIGEAANFYEDNKEGVNLLYKTASSVYKVATDKVLSLTQAAKILYLLKGFDVNENVKTFLEHIVGISIAKNTSAYYVYRNLSRAKSLGNVLNEKWVLGLIIKAWNNYINGNPQVAYLKYDSSLNLPPIMSDVLEVHIEEDKSEEKS